MLNATSGVASSPLVCSFRLCERYVAAHRATSRLKLNLDFKDEEIHEQFSCFPALTSNPSIERIIIGERCPPMSDYQPQSHCSKISPWKMWTRLLSRVSLLSHHVQNIGLKDLATSITSLPAPSRQWQDLSLTRHQNCLKVL